MILGLDISTSKIGYCILDNNKKIIANEFMKFKPLQLEDRAELFYDFLWVLNNKHTIEHVFIEEPFTMFGGGRTTAGTMAKLQIQWYVFICCQKNFKINCSHTSKPSKKVSWSQNQERRRHKKENY